MLGCQDVGAPRARILAHPARFDPHDTGRQRMGPSGRGRDDDAVLAALERGDLRIVMYTIESGSSLPEEGLVRAGVVEPLAAADAGTVDRHHGSAVQG
ncbi:hypothetical protein ABZ733_17515 [Streptomyces longwoodensis]|uniref:hypothetical protein n=1 Tax=Streptomyces longwoodensis TaxID=68231 RepID=UPI0033C5CD27